MSDDLPRMRDPRRAYKVVDMFEDELAYYTGAPFAVAVDSCTNALYLSLVYRQSTRGLPVVRLPRRTYVGVLQAARNAGCKIEWADEWDNWIKQGPPLWQMYAIGTPLGTPQKQWAGITDSARHLMHDMWDGDQLLSHAGELMCLSFHAAKQLPLGRGGAILTDDSDAAEWLRAARMDGRPPGAPVEATQFPGFHCPMPPDTAARGLWILSRWVDAGYDPPPLPHEDYPDLSLLQ